MLTHFVPLFKIQSKLKFRIENLKLIINVLKIFKTENIKKVVFYFLSIDDETVKRQLALVIFRYYGSRIIIIRTIKSSWITAFAEMKQMLFIPGSNG